MLEELLNVKELAKIIKVRQGTIYLWVSQEKIPHIKLGKRVLFDKSEIKKWIDQHKKIFVS